jgi:hypothetical protein
VTFCKGLISLADMLEFGMWQLGQLLESLDYYKTEAAKAMAKGGGEAHDGMKTSLNELLDKLRKYIEPIGLTASESHCVDLFRRLCGFEDDLGCSYQVVATGIAALQHSLWWELGDRKFLFIPSQKLQFFEQDQLFGEAVHTAFPSARTDIKDAGNAMVFDLHTAVVFHLMRVTEIGLRELARHLKVPIKKGHLEYLEWNQIIEQIEKQISTKKALPRGKKKAGALEFYHGVLGEFNAFKDVWRNNVMHTRSHYNDHDATHAYVHVRGFMQRLATKVSE